VDAEAAARRWADEWAKGWREHDADRIAALYADEAVFRSQPFREPHRGTTGAREYALWAFADEESVECSFGEPVAAGDRAAVEYWAVVRSSGSEETIAGIAVLRFDADGRVAEQRDYWAMQGGRIEPGEGWGR
jgi:ketosteroid isomerase-like protein